MVMPAMPVRSFAVYWADKATRISDDTQPRASQTHVRITTPSRGEMVDNKSSPPYGVKPDCHNFPSAISYL